MYDLSNETMKKRCVVLVHALVGKQHSDSWWHKYNKTLENTPHEIWKTDPTRVYKYLMGSVDVYT